MLEGVVNVLKPPGMSSSDVVTDIRHIFNMKRVGHTGTLDPGAAGVLPICIGRATRLFDYLVDKEKEYIGEITFGIATDTQDSYGAPEGRSDAVVTGEMLMEALPKFTSRPRLCIRPFRWTERRCTSLPGRALRWSARLGI